MRLAWYTLKVLPNLFSLKIKTSINFLTEYAKEFDIKDNKNVLYKSAFDTAMDKIRGMPLNEGERDSKKLEK